MSSHEERDDDAAPAVPREDAGPRAGEHPTARRSGSGKATWIALVALLVLALLMFAAIAAGILFG